MEEKDKKSNGDELYWQINILVKHGITGGILIPFSIPILTFIWDLWNKSVELKYPITKGNEIYVIGLIIVYSLIFFIVSYFILDAIHANIKQLKSKTITKILYILGIFSLFVLFFLIIWTGGLTKSPFSGYLIYVPVVVYITFNDIDKALISAGFSIILAISSTPAVNPLISGLYEGVDFSSYLYQWYYLIVLCWQIIASINVAVASKPFNIWESVKSLIKKIFICKNPE